MNDIMKGGIYKILNTTNGKQYIGSAVNLNRRKRLHWNHLRNNCHDNSHLQQTWNKYGEAAFEFRVIGKCPPERLIELEQEVMNHLKPEYNIAKIAGSCLGTKRSEEVRRKMSEIQKNRILSPEARRNISIAAKGNTNMLGKKHSEKARQKISEAGKDRAPSLETRQKMNKAKQGNKNALGHGLSKEARRKISETSKGRVVSPETRHKLSEANLGHIVTEETRRKIGKASRGRIHSPETRHKISETLKTRRAVEQKRKKE